MKKLLLLLTASAAALQLASAQPGSTPPSATVNVTTSEPKPEPQRFNLDFRGGSPKDLVVAIEKATGKPLNAIIPSQFENVQIPAVKVTRVTTSELFEAMLRASLKEVRIRVGTSGGAPSYQTYSTYYAFETRGHGEDSVWYFRAEFPPEPPQPPKACRFYQLAGYLEDYKIEDITTAIRTGWSLLEVKSPPELKFHPETKLLIAVGPPEQLETIDAVLQQLRGVPHKTAAPAPEGAPAKKDGAATKQ